jgi:hypothetical protein
MRLCTTLLLGLLTGCATTAPSKPEAPPPASSAPETPASAPAGTLDMKALLARELPPLSRQPVRAPEGAFTGEVEAAAEPTFQRQEGFLELSIPLGTGSPMECFVYDEPLDAGGALYRIVEMLRQGTDVRLASVKDVRLIGDSGAVYAEVLYVVDTPEGKGAGLAKLMVHASEQVPLVCTHDEPGYSESFQRISSGLAGSLRSAGEARPAPRYAEFHVYRLGDAPVGFEKLVMREVTGGSRLTETETSFFFPVSDKQWLVRDSVSTELADKDGRLVARDYVRTSNGEVDIQVALEQVKGREYRYEGKHGGKDVSGTFTASEDLATEPGTARVLREQLLSGRQKELTLRFYSPATDPAAPTPQVWRKEAAEGREVTIELGAMKVTATLDAQGMTEKLVTPAGNQLLVRERVSVSGTP